MTLSDTFSEVDCGICGSTLAYVGGRTGFAHSGQPDIENLRIHKPTPMPRGGTPKPEGYEKKPKGVRNV